MADSIGQLGTDADRKQWNRQVSHPLQAWEWGEFRQKMGIDVVRLTDSKRAYWQLTFHPIPKTPFTIGYFPKGPEITEEMVRELQTLGKKKRAVFIQLEPNILSSRFTVHGSRFLHPSYHPLFTKYTFVLDLSKSEKELMAAMHPKTRYNIRLAQRHGVKIQEDNSEEAFFRYLQLQRETLSRQGFYAHSTHYHQVLWQTLHPSGIARLFTATYRGKVLAAWIIFLFKNTIYYPYGASSREYREVMAPTLLLWEIARWAKAKGFASFDLWGALGPNPDPRDPWYGFHRFKEGFGPELVEFMGSYDLVLSPVLYRLWQGADRLRWWYLRTKSQGIS